MRLGIALSIAFCLVLSVSMASALQAPEAQQLDAEAGVGAETAVGVATGVGAETGMRAGAGLDAGAAMHPTHDGHASLDRRAILSIEARTPTDGLLASTRITPDGCAQPCRATHPAAEDPQGVVPADREPESQSFLRTSPVVWWSTALLVASAATKLWWLGPGRFTWLLTDFLRWGFAAALWTRMRSAYMLENENRARILRYIKENPGASIQEVQQHAEIAWGTAVYHLDRLARAGQVVGHRSRNNHQYWASGTPEARMRRGWALLSHGTANRIARAVAESPGVHQGAICEKAGVRAPSASKHLARLEKGGLVEKERVSRYTVYEATEELQRILEMQDGADAPGPAPNVARLDD